MGASRYLAGPTLGPVLCSSAKIENSSIGTLPRGRILFGIKDHTLNMSPAHLSFDGSEIISEYEGWSAQLF